MIMMDYFVVFSGVMCSTWASGSNIVISCSTIVRSVVPMAIGFVSVCVGVSTLF